jgi:hypothetical protein
MKRDSGMKDRDERSRGMEILIPEVVVKIKSTVRHVTGPFPVSPVPVLAGEVAHRYRL